MRGRKKKKVRAGRKKGLGNVKEAEGIVLTSVLGLSAAAGFALLVRHFYKKFIQDKVQKASLIEGNPATYATQLYQAMGNEHWYLQSNSDAIFSVLRSVPSRTLYAKVQDAYKGSYADNLNADLEKKLSPEQYNEAVRMISAKPA
jgi:hypothetical protein